MTKYEFVKIKEYQESMASYFPTEENKRLLEILEYISNNWEGLENLEPKDIVEASIVGNSIEVIQEKMKGEWI